MSKDKKPAAPQAANNVVSLAMCPAEKCGKKASRAEFCEEHFVWFKEGLINRTGEKAKDFDKKFQAYLMRHKKAA
ncbi:MAG: hypothetical protein AB7N80_11265 [Bdellovibrionales bacterium]